MFSFLHTEVNNWAFENFVNFPNLENKEAHHTLFVGGDGDDWIFSFVFRNAACISQLLVHISVHLFAVGSVSWGAGVI